MFAPKLERQMLAPERIRFTFDQAKVDFGHDAPAKESFQIVVPEQHPQSGVATYIAQGNRRFLPLFVKFKVMAAYRSDDAFKQVVRVRRLCLPPQQIQRPRSDWAFTVGEQHCAEKLVSCGLLCSRNLASNHSLKAVVRFADVVAQTGDWQSSP